MTATSTLCRMPGTNWIGGLVDGLIVTAKAYTEPGQYGMELDRRISKLWVKTPGLGMVLYDYDRNSLGVDYLNDDALAMIVAEVAKAL